MKKFSYGLTQNVNAFFCKTAENLTKTWKKINYECKESSRKDSSFSKVPHKSFRPSSVISLTLFNVKFWSKINPITSSFSGQDFWKTWILPNQDINALLWYHHHDTDMPDYHHIESLWKEKKVYTWKSMVVFCNWRISLRTSLALFSPSISNLQRMSLIDLKNS